ncbi:hypothetical protein HYE82_14635 [Streptomyces sp. BR123]|uniref:hypothetical protein n=1 Tax=Streptomyces sp. BR123 TaxID=2749828 RepID=UPI0015C41013|nr:hypothetical protein [Streptomyces sp. BR123]NXY95604.1 hypothetical protein [Streptomyces sp. BR123]
MTSDRWCRAVRAAVFAATCVLLAAIGHTLMSGAGVPGWALAAAFATTAGAAWALAGRERRLSAVTAAAVAVQGVLHELFSLAQAPVPHPPVHSTAAGMGGGHGTPREHGAAGTVGMDGMDGMAGTAGPDGMHGMHGTAGMSGSGMLAAHLLAALLCGLWLAYGEQAAFRILRALAGWFLAPLGLLPRLTAHPHRPRLRSRRPHRGSALRRLLLAHAFGTRGPPSGIAVV